MIKNVVRSLILWASADFVRAEVASAVRANNATLPARMLDVQLRHS